MQALNLNTNLFTPTGTAAPNTGTTANADTPSASVPTSSADTVTIGAIGVATARQIVTREIAISLEVSFASKGHRYDDDDHHRPNALSGHVLKHADKHHKDDDHDDSPARLNSIRAQVDIGFQQARSVLTNLGALQGDVADDVDQSEASVGQALDGLETRRASAAVAQSTREQSTELEIRTRDGDVVTLNISRLNETEAGAASNSNGDSVAFLSARSSLSVELSYSGDFDKHELKAISKLIKDVSKIADRFFDGRTEAAFNKLGKIKLHSNELAGFSLNLATSQTSAIALAAVTTQPSTNPTDNSTPAPLQAPTATPDVAVIGDEQAPIANLSQDIVAVATAPETEQLFADPTAAIKDLFNAIFDRHAGHDKPESTKHASGLVKQLVNNITDSLKDDYKHEHDEHDHHKRKHID